MKAYERLLKYVEVYTVSDENSDTHPTTLRQFDLANILVEEDEIIDDTKVNDVYKEINAYFTNKRKKELTIDNKEVTD